MQIDGVEVEKGSKKSLTLEAGETVLGSFGIPVTVINGAKDGPTLAVLAGCHPGEVVAITAAIKLTNEIDPKKLSGSLLIVPVQNRLGLQFKQAYVNPLDGMNFSSAYPHVESETSAKTDFGGASIHKAKSLSQQIAGKLFHEIVERADYLVDMHGGELHEALVPNIEVLMCGDAQTDNKTREFAKMFGIDLIWELTTGSIPEMPTYPSRGMLVFEAVKKGIPAAYCECGREGKIEENFVDISYGSILNLMTSLGMLEGTKSSVPHETLVGGRVIFSTRGGLFITKVNAGDHLSKNQELGHVMDLTGKTIETFRSSVDGVLLNMGTLGIANPGDMLYVIGSSVRPSE
jgi:uncharacterized protein